MSVSLLAFKSSIPPLQVAALAEVHAAVRIRIPMAINCVNAKLFLVFEASLSVA
jgi:hypothetical protein